MNRPVPTLALRAHLLRVLAMRKFTAPGGLHKVHYILSGLLEPRREGQIGGMGKDKCHLPFQHLPTVSRCSQMTLLPPTTLTFQRQGSKSTWASAKTGAGFSPRALLHLCPVAVCSYHYNNCTCNSPVCPAGEKKLDFSLPEPKCSFRTLLKSPSQKEAEHSCTHPL